MTGPSLSARAPRLSLHGIGRRSRALYHELHDFPVSGYLLAALALAVPSAAQQAPRELTPHQRAIAAGYKALTLCEGQFGGGRTSEQIAATELKGIYSEYEALVAELPATSDRLGRSVSVPFAPDMPPRIAYHMPRFGCSLAPIGGKRGTPPALHPNPSMPIPADPRPWPMGDGGIAAKPSEALSAAVATAFDPARSKGRTTGVLILRDGKIIAERYGVSLQGVPCIGDSLRDMQAAEAAGCDPHLVCTGRHADLLGQALPPGFPANTRIHADLAACVDQLLNLETAHTAQAA